MMKIVFQGKVVIQQQQEGYAREKCQNRVWGRFTTQVSAILSKTHTHTHTHTHTNSKAG